MRVLLFVLLEVLFYPVTLLGLLLFMGVILVVNRRQGISGSAYEPLMNRLIYHQLGNREDAATEQLARELPATSPLIWTLMAGPTRLAIRASGYLPAMLDCSAARMPESSLMNAMVVRTRFVDDAVERALGDAGQLVILGAGWDTRAYAMPSGWRGKVFEVDAPATQAAKLEAIRGAGIATSHVTYVAVDFNTTSWLEALQVRGFDPELPTCFVWEGVTMYLDEAAVTDTLRVISRLDPRCTVVFDYFAAEFVEGRKPFSWTGGMLPWLVWLTYGEKIRFGIPMHPDARGQLTRFLDNLGLELAEFDALSGVYGFGLARPASRGQAPAPN